MRIHVFGIVVKLYRESLQKVKQKATFRQRYKNDKGLKKNTFQKMLHH